MAELVPKKAELGDEYTWEPPSDLPQPGGTEGAGPSSGSPTPDSVAPLPEPSTSSESPIGAGPSGNEAPSSAGAEPSGVGTPTAGASPGTISAPGSSDAAFRSSGATPEFQGRGYRVIAPGVVYGNMTPSGQHVPQPTYSYYDKPTGRWLNVAPQQIDQGARLVKQPPPKAASAPERRMVKPTSAQLPV